MIASSKCSGSAKSMVPTMPPQMRHLRAHEHRIAREMPSTMTAMPEPGGALPQQCQLTPSCLAQRPLSMGLREGRSSACRRHTCACMYRRRQAYLHNYYTDRAAAREAASTIMAQLSTSPTCHMSTQHPVWLHRRRTGLLSMRRPADRCVRRHR